MALKCYPEITSRSLFLERCKFYDEVIEIFMKLVKESSVEDFLNSDEDKYEVLSLHKQDNDRILTKYKNCTKTFDYLRVFGLKYYLKYNYRNDNDSPSIDYKNRTIQYIELARTAVKVLTAHPKFSIDFDVAVIQREKYGLVLMTKIPKNITQN